MLIALLVLVVAKKSRTFFSFPCLANEQGCRSWEGAQPDTESQAGRWKYPILWTSCSVYKWGLAGEGGQESSLFPWVQSLSRVWQVLHNLWVWRNLWAPGNPQIPQSLLRHWLRISRWAVRKKEIALCVGLFCILISSSISFVVLLNCLYLNPRVLLFVPSPPHPTGDPTWPGCQLLG